MLALAVGVLAARSNSQVASAAIFSAQAGSIQAQLAYSRDFEREADRVGYQTLERAGFDPHGMAGFFSRLEKAGHIYERNAPVYMRSHPLTLERISDMQNRAQSTPYRQVVDSLDFHLVRAKLRAQMGLPSEALAYYETLLREKKYSNEAAARYGLIYALLRAKSFVAAQRELPALQRLKPVSPMIPGLLAELSVAMGDLPSAQAIYRDAMQRYPQSKSLRYGYAEALYTGRQIDQALRFFEQQQQSYAMDDRLYALQAKCYAAAGQRLLQYRAQAESYALQGRLAEAVEQLQLAQRAADANFYEQSAVDARLGMLRRELAEQAKEQGGAYGD